MKSKKELLLSAGLILTATLGLTGCSSNTPTTPAPETNTGEKVEVETVKPSTDENTTDSTVTPEPEVEVQKPTPEVETNSPIIENAEKKHPFGEIKTSQRSYQDWGEDNESGYVTRYMNYGQVEFDSTDFTKEDFLAFYEQEVKGSDYDRVEIRLSDDLGIIFLGTKGVFGVNTVHIDSTTGDWNVEAYSKGFIQKDGTIVYSKEIFETLNFGEDYLDDTHRIKILNEKLSTYEIVDGFTEYGLFLFVDPSFIPDGTEEEQTKAIKEAITTIVSEVKEMPGYTTLQRLMIYFGDSKNDYNSMPNLHIDFETLMTTDWDAFARGEFFLDEDQFSIELSNLNKPKG